MQAARLKVADVNLDVFEAGQGRPLLFLHGGGGFDPRQPFVAPLSAQRRLVVPAHPGFGTSSLPEWLDSVDDIAHLYLELMDVLKAKYGVDFSVAPRTLDDLRSPETIATAVIRARAD